MVVVAGAPFTISDREKEEEEEKDPRGFWRREERRVLEGNKVKKGEGRGRRRGGSGFGPTREPIFVPPFITVKRERGGGKREADFS